MDGLAAYGQEGAGHGQTFQGQRRPWCHPVPPPSAQYGSYRLTSGGLSPMLMRDAFETCMSSGDLWAAKHAIDNYGPRIVSLGRKDWREWVEDARRRFEAAVHGIEAAK